MLIHVLDLQTLKPRAKFTAKAFFTLHIANCYEDASGAVVVDFPAYTSAKMLHDLFIDRLRVSQR